MRLLAHRCLPIAAMLMLAVLAPPATAAPPTPDHAIAASAPVMAPASVVIAPTIATAPVVVQDTASAAVRPTSPVDHAMLAAPAPAIPLVRSERRRLHGGPTALGRLTRTPNLLTALYRSHQASRDRPPAS